MLKSLESEGFAACSASRLERTHIIIGVLDWIFVRGPFTIESGSVLRGTHGSDHDLVQAVLVPVGGSATGCSQRAMTLAYLIRSDTRQVAARKEARSHDRE